jgi:hypothetical protein
MGDGGETGTSARPPGKEGWFRIPAQLVANPWNGCFYEPGGWCAPVEVDRCDHAEDVKIACKAIDEKAPPDKRRFQLEPFDYRDALGVCHHAAATECPTGLCAMPETTEVPCGK